MKKGMINFVIIHVVLLLIIKVFDGMVRLK